MTDWMAMAPERALFIFISAILTYAALILFTRIAGVRSFSKMSGFDFAVTVAIGSIFASVIMAKDPSVIQGIVTLAILFSLQISFAYLRSRLNWVAGIADNKPRLIMIGQDIQHDQLKKAKMTVSDLHGKLREANVTNLSQVKCAIAETTGDVSILHGSDETVKVSPELLEGVIGAERMLS